MKEKETNGEAGEGVRKMPGEKERVGGRESLRKEGNIEKERQEEGKKNSEMELPEGRELIQP